MNRFLADFAQSVSPDTYAVMVMDGAGWHGARSPRVPSNVILVPLPA